MNATSASATLMAMLLSPDTRGDALLTGATGFLGMELSARLLEDGDRRVWVLVRASDEVGARAGGGAPRSPRGWTR
jgi:NAD(P)-dependent dehydrogenase (short-subunit alcohol dehydrogenase family)